MKLSIVTAVSRPENLPAIHHSIASTIGGSGVDLTWLLVLDTPGVLAPDMVSLFDGSQGFLVTRIVFPGGRVKFGIAQKNMGLDSFKDGFYHLLDDDNIVHPDFFLEIGKAASENPEKRAFVFGQRRWDRHGDLKAAPERMRRAQIDNTMFVVKRDFIGDLRYDFTRAGAEDFFFFRALFDRDPKTFVFLDKWLAYYNYLKHFPENKTK